MTPMDRRRWELSSSSDQRIVFGLGSAHEAGELDILWPDQVKQRVAKLALNSYTTIMEAAAP